MKILVTGANGQLGSEMRVLSLSYNTFEWVFADKKQLNLADLINLESKLEIISPDLIINSAAYTNVANAENERKITNSINNHAVSIIAKWSFDNKVSKAIVLRSHGNCRQFSGVSQKFVSNILFFLWF